MKSCLQFVSRHEEGTANMLKTDLQQGLEACNRREGRWMPETRVILEENMLDAAKDFSLGWRFTFLKDNHNHRALLWNGLD